MAVNKVVINNETQLDLTSDTVSPDTLSKGITAHDKSGNVIVGTMTQDAPTGQWREETVDDQYGQITKVVYHGYTIIPSLQYNRKRLTSIKFNEGVTTIQTFFMGTNAGGYDVLNELIFPSTLSEIEDYFMYDVGQTGVQINQNNAYAVMTVKPTLPLNLKKIGKYCFNLTITAASGSWELPDSIEELGQGAFYIPRGDSDDSFTLNVKFGSGLSTLKGAPFYTYLGRISKYKYFVYDFRKSVSIPTLTTATLIGLKGKTYDTVGSAYTGETDVLTIIVPDELYDEWKAATNWVAYASCFKKASEVTE